MKDIREKNYSKEELKESLFEYLSLDLQTIMEKRKEPLIVFIDTYEKYFNSFIKDKVRLSNEEEWLRKLIDEVPYVLWVISGRESIEKNDEALVTTNELNHSKKYKDYFVIRKDYISDTNYTEPLTSYTAQRLTQDEIKEMIDSWRESCKS